MIWKSILKKLVNGAQNTPAFKKRAVTLFELMIVILLIALSASVVAIPIVKAFRRERFTHDVDGVIDSITLAQQIMLDFNTPVQLVLKQADGEITCTLEADLPLPPAVKKGLQCPKLRTIETMAFNQESLTTITLHFEGPLSPCTKGTLTLQGVGRRDTIFLPGYPCGIQRGKHDQIQTIDSAKYPQEIFSPY
jgi:type II secretory pathway pseudopilin PulG